MRSAALFALLCLLPATPAGAAPAPDFAAVTLGGDSLRLGNFRGKPVLVEFWAPWCTPCREQLPVLAGLESQVEGLVVLAIAEEKRRDRVARFVERVRSPRRVLLDTDGRIAAAYAVDAMPWAVLIAPDGHVLWQGPRVGSAATVRERLAETRGGK
jgi:thiol-disulfide isomerase/thioredoxin